MSDDLIVVVTLLSIINFLILFSWAMKKLFPELPNLIPRKFLHITAIVVAGISFPTIVNQNYLILIGTIILIGNYFMFKKGVFEDNLSDRRNFGIFFVPISYLILVFALNNHRQIAMFSMFVLGFSDGIAAVIGGILRIGRYKIGKADKTLIGSFFFALPTFVIFYWAALFIPGGREFLAELPNNEILIYAIFFTILLTLIEAVSYSGFDNLFLPLSSAILLYVMIYEQDKIFDAQQLLYGIILVLFVVLISKYAKFLTTSGIAAASIVGLIIFGFGGIKWSVPLLSFFFFSSILSKVRKISGNEFEKGSNRDLFQVFANGAIPVFLLIIYLILKKEVFYNYYLIALATATADTWGTEFGTLAKNKTYSIVNLREVPQGTSGGISAIGTFGAFLGAVVILLSGYYWLTGNIFVNSIFIVLFGFFGMVVDSLIGALFQRKNKCVVCGKITEKKIHCGEKTEYFTGIKFIDNDIVNFLSISLSVLLAFSVSNWVML